MTKKGIASGDTIDIPDTTGLNTENLDVLQELVVFVTTPEVANGAALGYVRGRFSVPKAAGAINPGDALFFNPSNDNVQTTGATGTWFCGHAASAALSGDPEVDLNLNDAPAFAAES